MASYFATIVLLLAALAVPLFANKCNEGHTTFQNGQIISSTSLSRVDCGGGDYCAIQTEIPLNDQSTRKVLYFCGNKPAYNGYNTCSSAGDYYSNDGTYNYQTSCCKGNYCNSSTTMGTLATFVISCLALFFNKLA